MYRGYQEVSYRDTAKNRIKGVYQGTRGIPKYGGLPGYKWNTEIQGFTRIQGEYQNTGI